MKVEQAKRMKELEKENGRVEAVGGGVVAGEASFEGRGGGKLLSPKRRRCAVERAERDYGMSERHACWGKGEERNDTVRGFGSMKMS